MNEFFASLISGVVSLFMQNKMNEKQHAQNISDWQMQNQYNERMYNNYNSPVARAEQLGDAGLSDAAIGQALSGFNGSGTTNVSPYFLLNLIAISLVISTCCF